jgi:hypothetical protein
MLECRPGNSQALQSAVFFIPAKADMDSTQRGAICGTPHQAQCSSNETRKDVALSDWGALQVFRAMCT